MHVCNGVIRFVSMSSRQSRLSKEAGASCATRPQFISRLTKCFTHTCISRSKSFTQRHKCARANARECIVGKECTNRPIHKLRTSTTTRAVLLRTCTTGFVWLTFARSEHAYKAAQYLTNTMNVLVPVQDRALCTKKQTINHLISQKISKH